LHKLQEDEGTKHFDRSSIINNIASFLSSYCSQFISCVKAFSVINEYQSSRFLLDERKKAETTNSSLAFEIVANKTGLSIESVKEKIHNGENARLKLISGNMRLVYHIAKFYINRGVEVLILEGTSGCRPFTCYRKV
jgi:DNA-directed RNA polymerase sigma subunit (sigma70/sigma32)